jgi:molybdopterin synthase catalytic subunit
MGQRYEVLLTRAALDRVAAEHFVRDPAAGAIVTFLGVTRNQHDGKAVLRLEYEAHEALARKTMTALCEQTLHVHPVIRIALQHRVGPLQLGDASVIIAVSAAHRGDAYEASRFLIDTLKTTVPIWKKEFYADNSPAKWVGPDGKAIMI